MQTDILKKMVELSLKNKEIPFFITATTGTTVLGAFDHINSIADICHQNNLWLHVDVLF